MSELADQPTKLWSGCGFERFRILIGSLAEISRGEGSERNKGGDSMFVDTKAG